MLEESTAQHLAATFAKLPYPVVVLDVESTGGNLNTDRVTEVAYIRFQNGQFKRFSQLINPEQPIPIFVQELTGISNEMVEQQPTFSYYAPELLNDLTGSLLVAHNSHFDYTFLKQEFARANLDYAAPNLCTVKFSKKLYPAHYKHSLETIINRFGFILENRHRAMADVEALCMFLNHSLQEHGEECWLDSAQALMNPKPAPEWISQKLSHIYYELPDSPAVIRMLDNNNNIIYQKALAQCFTDIARLLNQPNAHTRFEQLETIQYQKAIGSLHAYILAHQNDSFELQYTNKQPFYTILLGLSHTGYIETHIKPITQSLLTAAPIGLFLSAKAARKAIFQWAKTHQICPKALNILQPTPPKTEPCPVKTIGHCPNCVDEADTITQHNDNVLSHLDKLPCVGFNQHRAFSITEKNHINQDAISFTVKAGAVLVAGNQWLFSEKLVQILKKKIQQHKDDIEILN